jgi:ABC-2 type transport system ATP-binding protein
MVSASSARADSPVATQAPSPGFALRCMSLVKHFGDVKAVDGVDLEVGVGECFGLLGPNGAGKTTTVEILEGLTVPDSGTVEVLGYRWRTGHDREMRNLLGVQLQDTQLAEKLTVEETIRLFRSFYTKGRDTEEVIQLVGLGEKRKGRVGKLSGGQKQRLAVACALVGDPALLFLDEPTTGLDPQARLKLWDIVEQFKSSGGSILLTTHYMEEAARLCDRVAIMDHGHVIALGSPSELVDSLGAHQIVEFSIKGHVPAGSLTELPGVRGVRATGDGNALTVTEIAEALPALLALIRGNEAELLTLTTHQATLEDVFVALTGRMLRDG